MTLVRIHLASLLVLVCIGFRSQIANAQFGNGHWLTDFGGYLPTDNRINSAAYDAEGGLFLAGDFSQVQGVETGAFARWYAGEIDRVENQFDRAGILSVIDGKIFVFGEELWYLTPDVVDFHQVFAAWDGNVWHDLRTDLSSGLCLMQMNAIVEHQDEIYIGGRFRLSDGSSNIGRLTDAGWEGLGGGMTGPFVFDCLFADVRAIVGESDGSLLVGGEFEEVAGMPAKYLVRRDGEAWRTVEHEPPSPVEFMVSDEQGGLFVSGTEEADSWPYPSWIGQWSESGLNQFPSFERGIEAMYKRPGGSLMVSAGRPYDQYGSAERLSEWTGTEWIEYGGPFIGVVWQIGETPSGELFIAGDFTTVGPSPVTNFAVWNGQDWEAVLSDTNRGPDRAVLDMVRDPDGHSVIVAGDFLSVAGQPIRYVARWTGTSWEAVGDPLDGQVSSLVLSNNEMLIASGRFTTDGKTEFAGIARSVDGEWQPIPGFVGGPIEASTSCPNGSLFAANRSLQILRWDGTSIDTVGHAADGEIMDLACGRDNRLYVGGSFTQIDGVAVSRIASWSDGRWQALGSGVNSWVTSLAVDGQARLFAGGLFYSAGDQPANHLAMWDGDWSDVGGGVNGSVYAVITDSVGRVYVGGRFTTAGTLEVDGLAAWGETDGWSAPSPGLEGGHVESLALIGNDLWVGGTFTSAGGQPSNRLAVYAGVTTTQSEREEIPGRAGAPNVTVFPNPVVAGTRTTIELSSTVPGHVSVDVFDVLGRHVTSVFDGRISTSGQRLSLDTNGLVPGVYFLRATTVRGEVVRALSFLVR